MKSEKLPSVLLGHGKVSSISMERALKQVKDCLEEFATTLDSDGNWGPRLRAIHASMNDVDVMIAAIDRSGE